MKAFLTFACSLCLSGCAASRHIMQVSASASSDGKCLLLIGNNSVDLHDQVALKKALRPLLPDLEIRVIGGTETPYRCIGGAIYMMQMMGISKVGFIAEPPSSPRPAR